MTTTPTQLPVPSESPIDLKFNAGKIDEFVTSFALQYIDRFGNAHYTIEGLRKLAEQAIAAFGWVPVDSFQDGATLTLPNEVLRWKLPDGDGEYYRWDGDFPKVVPAGSTPEDSGGVGPGAWLSIGDATLRTMLASSAGAGMVGTTSGNTVQTELDSLKVVANVRDPQFAGGAKGDWNTTTQTGTDDTAAFQAAIDYLASLPTRRNAGSRVLFVPQGMYRVKNLVVPSSFSFGFNMVGESRDSSVLYMLPDDVTVPCIEIQSEFSNIRSITIFGDKKDIWDESTCAQAIIRNRLPDGRADCDLRIESDVLLGCANTLIEVYGRGVILSGTYVSARTGLKIVAQSAALWDPGSASNDFDTGMRNYQIDHVRTDAVADIVAITGTGTAKDYINNITISNVDILGANRLVYFPDATIVGCSISNVSATNSFSIGVLVGKSITGISMNGGSITKWTNIKTKPTQSFQFMSGIVNLTGYCNGATISAVNFGPVRQFIINVGLESRNIRIVNCVFNQSWDSSGTILTGANCIGIQISGNTFTGTVTGNIQPWSQATQTSPNAVFYNNHAPYHFLHNSVIYTPVVKCGTTTLTPGLSACRFSYDGYFCTARFAISVPVNGAAGNFTVSTPMTPLADFSAVSSDTSGGGVVNHLTGSAPIGRVQVRTGSIIYFYKSDGTQFTGADIPGTLNIEFDVKFVA